MRPSEPLIREDDREWWSSSVTLLPLCHGSGWRADAGGDAPIATPPMLGESPGKSSFNNGSGCFKPMDPSAASSASRFKWRCCVAFMPELVPKHGQRPWGPGSRRVLAQVKPAPPSPSSSSATSNPPDLEQLGIKVPFSWGLLKW